MNITLGDASGGVTEERGDGELGKAQVTSNAAKGVAQCERRNTFDFGSHT